MARTTRLIRALRTRWHFQFGRTDIRRWDVDSFSLRVPRLRSATV